MKQASLPGFDDEEENSAKGDAPQSGLPEPLGTEVPSPHSSSTAHPSSLISHPSSIGHSDPTSLAGQSVWVVDSHSLIHQVFHALPEMTSPKGEPVGAVFGFTRDLFFLLEEKRPDYLFCAFDLPGKTFRHAMYDQYKIQRAEMHEDLVPQIPAIRRVIAALGIPALSCESFEADDVLATVARMADELGGQSFLVTGDKDCRQLITDRVKVYNIRKNETFDREMLRAEWGVSPEQVVDFQALVGDSVDNVPGVPLIGPKFARQLLEQFATLQAVLDHAAEVPGAKRKENLLKFRDQALLSRDLVRLNAHVPLAIDWNAARPGRIDFDTALALFRDFGFRGFTQKIVSMAKEGRAKGGKGKGEGGEGKDDNVGLGTSVPSGTGAETDFITPQGDRLGTEVPSPVGSGELGFVAHLVDTPGGFEAFLAQLRQQRSFSLDTETTSVRPRWAKLVGMSFAWNDAEAWYLPLRSPAGEAHLDPTTTLAALKPILEDPTVAKTGQNLKYDMIVLRGEGINLAGVAFDTMVASYLLEAGRRNHNLDELARTYLNHETIKISELIGKGKNQRRMDEVPVRQVADYAAEDAWLPVRLQPILARKLEEADRGPGVRRQGSGNSGQWSVASGQYDPRGNESPTSNPQSLIPNPLDSGPHPNPLPKGEGTLRGHTLTELLHDLELPLIDVLVEMEYNGIKVDVARLAELCGRYGEKMESLEAEIHLMAGRPINIASPKQLQALLFDELKLPIVKKTATTVASTDAEVLEELAPLHPLPAKILEYRQYAKLKSTYVDALPELICPETGRIHASFNQVVTATGRLSSSDPNLQNIPVRTQQGREIRSAFVPGHEGWLLLAADYSQIELRVLAHFSGDARLCEAFARDEDIHARVASQVNGVPLAEVTSEMRRAAKAVNFGVIYGQSPFGLARGLGIDQDAAAKFIDSYFGGYPGIEEFLAGVLADCRQNGYVRTILGRRRAISGVREGAGRQRNLAERTAVNTVIQGSAADLIKQAMVAIHRRLRTERLSAKMLLQIHDELIFEVPADQLHHLTELVTEEMVGACTLNVPLKVDIKAGPTWAATEEVGSG
jgi:DNA polymerase I